MITYLRSGYLKTISITKYLRRLIEQVTKILYNHQSVEVNTSITNNYRAKKMCWFQWYSTMLSISHLLIKLSVALKKIKITLMIIQINSILRLTNISVTANSYCQNILILLKFIWNTLVKDHFYSSFSQTIDRNLLIKIFSFGSKKNTHEWKTPSNNKSKNGSILKLVLKRCAGQIISASSLKKLSCKQNIIILH